VTRRAAGSRRCPSLAVWLGLVASLLLMVGGVWDIAWHHTRGRDTFWSPPHLVLYGGVGLMSLVCLATVRRPRGGRRAGPGTDSALVERWGLRAPRGFAVAGEGVFAVLSAPVDEAWHWLVGVDVTIWSPPHLFAIAAAGAIRLGLVIALVDEMARVGPTIPRQRLGLAWPRTTLAEGVLLALFSILLGNLLFALGDHAVRAVSRGPVLYPLLASLTVPVVLVAGSRTLGRLGAAAGIVLVLLAFQALLRAGLCAVGFGLPPPWPLWPLYLVPALVVDGWCGLVRRRPQAVGHDAVAGLLFAGGFIGPVAGEAGSPAGVFESLDWLLLTALLVAIAGAASGWAGAQLQRWLLTASPAGRPQGLHARTGTTSDASAPPRRDRSRSRP
jgi:hypothetical protein